ncbi:Hypothetical Protein PANA_4170 [Pantoea ananatis LMG 20103]|uniref:Uncharacterized protein n=1 Tax=Pantoea ananatis (strain LMG 20103) TaxID=706191 RepID=D4GFL7_PANAM|nr:Hypothetical Protein PANA_4170 [Pantoea ananatis LMG 20103]
MWERFKAHIKFVKKLCRIIKSTQLIAGWIPQIGDASSIRFSDMRRCFSRSAAVFETFLIPAENVFRGGHGKANGTPVGKGRGLAINGLSDNKTLVIFNVKRATQGINALIFATDHSKNSIVEFFSLLNIIRTNNHMAKHI